MCIYHGCVTSFAMIGRSQLFSVKFTRIHQEFPFESWNGPTVAEHNFVTQVNILRHRQKHYWDTTKELPKISQWNVPDAKILFKCVFTVYVRALWTRCKSFVIAIYAYPRFSVDISPLRLFPPLPDSRGWWRESELGLGNTTKKLASLAERETYKNIFSCVGYHISGAALFLINCFDDRLLERSKNSFSHRRDKIN